MDDVKDGLYLNKLRGLRQCIYKKKNKKTLLFFPETHYTVI